ncbi:MAG: putative membrane protein YhiD involved in acid resistance [Myxococcota bacterium]|jgi:uncharacterized membrane protein YhiD involved in acid resistance
MNPFDALFNPTAPTTLQTAALSLVMTFALSQAISAVYMRTFRGMSYSRSFVQTVAIGSIVACMLMLAINNSIAAGLGIAGSLAIIRFRTAMRDPRDMVFVFASLGAGIAAGLKSYGPAVLGTVVFCLAALLLTWTDYGTQQRFDGLLRIELPPTPDAEAAVNDVLRRHTRRFSLVTLREVAQGESMQYAYQVRLPTSTARSTLVHELEKITGSRDVSLLLQEPTVEI